MVQPFRTGLNLCLTVNYSWWFNPFEPTRITVWLWELSVQDSFTWVREGSTLPNLLELLRSRGNKDWSTDSPIVVYNISTNRIRNTSQVTTYLNSKAASSNSPFACLQRDATSNSPFARLQKAGLPHVPFLPELLPPLSWLRASTTGRHLQPGKLPTCIYTGILSGRGLFLETINQNLYCRLQECNQPKQAVVKQWYFNDLWELCT